MRPDVRVLALVPYPLERAPGQRFRMEQWAPRLRSEGVEVEFAPLLSAADFETLYERGRVPRKVLAVVRGYRTRLRQLESLRTFDVAYIYREAAFLGPAWVERLVARRCPIVFDFDDAIYLPATSAANRPARFAKRRGKTAAICRVAQVVTVGNEVLAAFARRHAPRVEVIPTTMDTDVYRVTVRDANPRPVVGWTGSPTTAGYLQSLAPALRRLRERLDFELRVIGAVVAIDGIDVTSVPWRAESEAEDLRPIDVGLMPLTDDDWARGKCAAKALQYMALGIPPVVSPVGVNATVVRDGVNGFHAQTDADWVGRIAELLGAPALRARLGAAARRTVEEGYSAQVQVPRLAEVLRRAAGAAGP